MGEFDAYRGLFVAESRENHENLVKNLLILEKGTDQNAIDELFRSCHTLKGASASMGYAEMERLCHTMEDVFQLVRSGTAEITQDLGDLLLACTDLIEQMIDDVEGGGDTSSMNADEQVNALKEWIGERGGKEKKEKTPAAAPAVDAAAEPERAPLPLEGNVPEFDIQITVSSECMMKDVRAMLAIGNLESLGTITAINPSKEAIDEGEFDGVLTLRIASDAGEEALKTAASGTEIASVDI
jgi:two-component system chemotaxis sensor kinase CheA